MAANPLNAHNSPLATLTSLSSGLTGLFRTCTITFSFNYIHIHYQEGSPKVPKFAQMPFNLSLLSFKCTESSEDVTFWEDDTVSTAAHPISSKLLVSSLIVARISPANDQQLNETTSVHYLIPYLPMEQCLTFSALRLILIPPQCQTHTEKVESYIALQSFDSRSASCALKTLGIAQCSPLLSLCRLVTFVPT